MWESPIQMITDDIIKDLVQKQDCCIVEYVHRVGFDVDKAELAKALAYDRDQYEKGYADGWFARDSEIVRCKDCKHYKKLKDVDGLKFCTYVIGAEFVREFDDYCSRGERKDGEQDEL